MTGMEGWFKGDLLLLCDREDSEDGHWFMASSRGDDMSSRDGDYYGNRTVFFSRDYNPFDVASRYVRIGPPSRLVPTFTVWVRDCFHNLYEVEVARLCCEIQEVNFNFPVSGRQILSNGHPLS